MLLLDLGHITDAIALVHQTKLSDSMIERWHGWATPSPYQHYAPVFDAIGVRPG